MRVQSTEGGKAGSEVDTNLHQKVYYHKLGTSQEEDPLIFETPDEPTLIFGVEVTGSHPTLAPPGPLTDLSDSRPKTATVSTRT